MITDVIPNSPLSLSESFLLSKAHSDLELYVVIFFLTCPSDLFIGWEIVLSHTPEIFLSLPEYISGFKLLLGYLLYCPWS